MLSESPWRTERCPQGLAIREVSEDLPDASTLPWPPHREASTAGVSTGLHCAGRWSGPPAAEAMAVHGYLQMKLHWGPL